MWSDDQGDHEELAWETRQSIPSVETVLKFKSNWIIP